MCDRSSRNRAAAAGGRLCVVLAALAGVVASTGAQSTAPATRRDTLRPGPGPAAADQTPRLVQGRVVRPTATDIVPVPGIWVTLHRVGSDTAGPIDSVRSGRDGRYAFRYTPTGRADAVYFVSASYDGIAYFSLPLRGPRVTGPDAEVTVYDTTSGPLALHVRGRHMIISAPHPDGSRDVVEVYEITNDSSVTLVSPDDAHPTWSTIVPASATEFEVGQGDLSPRSIRHEVGRVSSVAPFSPGLKQLSFGYRLPATAFPLSVPLERAVTVLEVLTEDPGAEVSGARLTPVAPVAIEGRPFHRFIAQDVPANAVFIVRVPSVLAASTRGRYLAGLSIAMAIAMLGALALGLARRGRGHSVAAALTAPAAPREEEVARLARAIAALDVEFERDPSPSSQAREAYRERRDQLKRALAHALDAQRSRG